MGSCGSAKKHNINGSVNGTKKNSLDSKVPNGIVSGVNSARRKSIKLQEFDRISNATILDATEIGTNKEYAVKMIPKSSSPEMSFEMLKFVLKNEIEICLELKHENVINCYKVFEDTIAVYFIFELIDGGDLFNFIQTFPNRKIPEYRVIEIFIQILDALHYVHCEKDVVHKDIKPENFLIYTEGSKLNVKLIDFGFAEKKFYPEQKLKIEAGSLPYISPEMIQHTGYDAKSDMFSVGVVLFNMLTGKQPYFGRNDDERRNSILMQEPVIPKEITNPLLIDMIKGLLEKDPDKRLSVQEAKMHPWIQDYINLHQQQTVKKDFVPNLSNSKNLNNLVKITNIKNIVWMHLLTYLNIEVAYKVRNYLFDNFSYDKDNNQMIEGKFAINYDSFLEAVIKVAEDNQNLVAKLQEILNNNRDMCKEHIINFVDLIDFFIKSRVILVKEKTWNYYRNIEDNDTQKIVLFVDILNYIEDDLNANQKLKLTNIARDKGITLDTPLRFDSFDLLFQEYENTEIIENRRQL